MKRRVERVAIQGTIRHALPAAFGFAVLVGVALVSPPRVYGTPESTAHPTCDLGERTTDREHPELHTCPSGFSQSDCWSVWQRCEDTHGHQVAPLLNEEVECAKRECRVPDCGPAADRLAVGTPFKDCPGPYVCKAHTGTRIRDGALEEKRRLFPK